MSVVHSTAPFWQDPGNIAINRRQSHVPLHSFRSAAGAVQQLSRPPWVTSDAAQRSDSRKQELSGCEWDFKVFESPAAAPKDFWKEAFDASSFGQVSSDCAAV